MHGDIRLIDGIAEATSHTDRDDALHGVARLFREYLDARSVALYRATRDGSRTRLRRLVLLDAADAAAPTDGPHPVHPPTLEDGSIWHRCIEEQRIVVRPGHDGHTLTAFPSENQRNEVLGVFVAETRAPLVDKESALLRGILRILRNHVALLEYGQRDTLTELLNRKTFEAQFDRVRHRLTAGGQRVESNLHGWLGLIDIDRFKAINDTFGHLFGDEVLLLISQIIRRAFRSSDLLYRFGGEEFVVLLPSLAEQHAAQAFERLRAAVEAYSFPQVGRVTVSLGWTRINSIDGPTTCLERADNALYQAKRAGRNQCCRDETYVTAKPPESGAIELF